MQSLSNCQALTGREQLSKAGSSLKAAPAWWAKELSQPFGWPWDVTTVQAPSLCFCLFLPCFLEVFITWYLILRLMSYLVDTLLVFFSKFCIIEYMYNLGYLDGESRVFGMKYSVLVVFKALNRFFFFSWCLINSYYPRVGTATNFFFVWVAQTPLSSICY